MHSICSIKIMFRTVSICLQESSSAFGSHICEEVEMLWQKFGNICVTAAELGKLN
jgi:hypothetical protein